MYLASITFSFRLTFSEAAQLASVPAGVLFHLHVRPPRLWKFRGDRHEYDVSLLHEGPSTCWYCIRNGLGKCQNIFVFILLYRIPLYIRRRSALWIAAWLKGNFLTLAKGILYRQNDCEDISQASSCNASPALSMVLRNARNLSLVMAGTQPTNSGIKNVDWPQAKREPGQTGPPCRLVRELGGL